MYQKLVDVSIDSDKLYEIKSIIRADEVGKKPGHIATYKGQYGIASLERVNILVQDFWSTITYQIQVGDADRLVMGLEDVELLNSRVSYLADNGSWRLHTLSYP